MTAIHDPAATPNLTRDLERYLATLPAGFAVNADTLTYWADAADVPRARLGGLIQGAHQRGLIRPNGIMRSRRKAARGRLMVTWLRTDKAVQR